ncbi:MAG TPA: ROK family protein, partial [Terrimicrobiaceae bacterium]|nr:ROK family protein [Terrimicrobiaceae bacterium]
ALTGLVRYLMEEGLVIESEETRAAPSSGRPARLMQINSSARSVLGIDIEPDHLRIAVTDLGGAILNYRQIVCDRQQTPEARFALIKTVTRDMGVKPGSVVRVGASCAGLLDEPNGILLGSTNLPKWKNVPVRDWLEEIYGVPANIGRSIHQAAWAEHWFREESGSGKMLVVTLRTGVGFALVDNGIVYHGRDRFDGELGHTLIDINGSPCECGRRGCLETFISPASMTRRISEKVRQGKAQRLAPLLAAGLEVDPEMIYRMAREGDADCRGIVDDLVHYLGIGIGNLVNLLNPDRVVLCGAIEVVNEELLHSLRKEIQQQCLPQSWQNLEVRLSKHAERSALLGAAVRAAQDHVNAVVQTHAHA